MSEIMPGALPLAPYLVQRVPAKPKFFLKHEELKENDRA